MKKTLLLTFLIACSISGAYAQCKTCVNGMHDPGDPSLEKTHRVADSSGGLAKSYLLQNVCGLNWQQSSVLVETRSKGAGFNKNGTGLPATVPLTFDSCSVDSVIKAFLYFNGSYQTPYAANPANLSITNPALSVFTYLVDSIGTAGTKCWGERGTIAYRADVTTCINGGGNYTVNITGTGMTAWAIDGISLVVIYKDRSATYSGSIALYDGLYTSTGGSHTQTFSGFNVCSATPTGQAFAILADMQSNACSGTNTENYNGSISTFPNLFYNFCTVTTSLAAAQTSTTYDVYTNNLGCDCYSWVLAGLYWQNTNCEVCVPSVVATNILTIVPPKDTICQGDSVQLKASGDSSYIWIPATGLSCTNCPNPKASPNSTTTYTVTGYIGCTIGKDTVQVVVSPKIVPSITPSNPKVCPGDSVKLTASGGLNYVWKPATGLSCTNCTSPMACPPVTTTYTLVSGANGCKDSTTVTVTVVPTPTVSVAPKSPTICQGSGVTLNASGASTYTWTPATGLSCNTCPNPLASPTVTTTYTVVGANGACTDTTTDTVHVVPATVGTITVKPASDTICNGDSAMLVGGGGGTYDWTFSGSPNDTIWVKPATSTIYTLQVTKNGCIATVNVKIIVIGAGAPKITVSKDSICKGDSTMLTATGGGTYKWLVPGNPTSASIWVKPGANATYSVVVTTPCGNDTAVSKLIHVFPYPVITSSGNTSICRGSTANISASGGTSYVWSPGGSTNSTISVNPNNTTTYTVAVSNGNCTKDTTITVTVDTPAVLTITPNQKICIGDSTTLTATGGPGYKWSNGATTSSITVTPGTTTTYTCVVTKNGCIDSTSCTVTVDIPVLNACCDKTITPGGADTIGASGSLSYVWSPGTNLSFITANFDSVIATPTVTTTYTVTGTDAAGCKVSRQVTVIVETPCSDFTVPNIFTPNNDGRNDDFVINVLNPSSYSIVIYDRWGKEVYTSTDPTVYWNGRVLNTQYMASEGVYYYIIKATCGSNTYDKKGFVQIIGEQ
jgi:gliding motility-associated-like protein